MGESVESLYSQVEVEVCCLLFFFIVRVGTQKVNIEDIQDIWLSGYVLQLQLWKLAIGNGSAHTVDKTNVTDLQIYEYRFD